MLVTEEPQKSAEPGRAQNGTAQNSPTRTLSTQAPAFPHPDQFPQRHIGPNPAEARQMLDQLGFSTLETLIDEAVPEQIRLTRPLKLPPARPEYEVLGALKEIAGQNQ